MTLHERTKEWMFYHLPWVIFIVAVVASYGLGWIMSTIYLRADYMTSLSRTDAAYIAVLHNKDMQIAKLSTATLKAATLAQDAATTAQNAADKVAEVAEKRKR